MKRATHLPQVFSFSACSVPALSPQKKHRTRGVRGGLVPAAAVGDAGLLAKSMTYVTCHKTTAVVGRRKHFLHLLAMLEPAVGL